MKTISKRFATLRDAGIYQNRLYNKFNHVKLISFPFSNDAGIYVWEVN